MAVVLITGANRGIGLALAERFLAQGDEVLVTARETSSLPQTLSSARAFELDVADLSSIDRLHEQLQGRGIDILVNNAGIFGPRGMHVGKLDHHAWPDVFLTNVRGPAALSEALLGNLRAGALRKIATISSRMGSLSHNLQGGEMIYRASKAAVNAAMRSMAMELADDGFTIFNLHPGWVRTDMGGANAAISVEESADGLLETINLAGPSANGGFFNYDGAVLTW